MVALYSSQSTLTFYGVPRVGKRMVSLGLLLSLLAPTHQSVQSPDPLYLGGERGRG